MHSEIRLTSFLCLKKHYCLFPSKCSKNIMKFSIQEIELRYSISWSFHFIDFLCNEFLNFFSITSSTHKITATFFDFYLFIFNRHFKKHIIGDTKYVSSTFFDFFQMHKNYYLISRKNTLQRKLFEDIFMWNKTQFLRQKIDWWMK